MYFLFTLFKNPMFAIRYFRSLKAIKGLGNKCDVIFVIPSYHTGGAEKVHEKIASVYFHAGYKLSFVFAEKSKNDILLSAFKSYGQVVDLGLRYDHKYLGERIGEKFLKKINSIEEKVIFTSNCRYFYNLLLEINKHKIIDLVHAFEPGVQEVNLEFKNVFPKICKRVFINEQSFKAMRAYYKDNSLDTSGLNLIYNAPFEQVQEPLTYTEKSNHKIEVNFVARNSPEKSPGKAFEIAQLVTSQFPGKFKFTMIGDFDSFRDQYESIDIEIQSGLNDSSAIIDYYKKAHIVLLTSSTEGFPLVLAEAMFYSAFPISTNVGGIGFVIQQNVNGIMVNYDKDLIENVVNVFERVANHNFSIKELSLNSFNTAKSIFEFEAFKNKHLKILEEVIDIK